MKTKTREILVVAALSALFGVTVVGFANGIQYAIVKWYGPSQERTSISLEQWVEYTPTEKEIESSFGIRSLYGRESLIGFSITREEYGIYHPITICRGQEKPEHCINLAPKTKTVCIRARGERDQSVFYWGLAPYALVPTNQGDIKSVCSKENTILDLSPSPHKNEILA